jgi:hypothetical protein
VLAKCLESDPVQRKRTPIAILGVFQDRSVSCEVNIRPPEGEKFALASARSDRDGDEGIQDGRIARSAGG